MVAVNPVSQQTGLLKPMQQLFSPAVMSLNKAAAPTLYSVGLMNPTGPKAFFRRRAFSSEIIAAKTGAEADVP